MLYPVVRYALGLAVSDSQLASPVLGVDRVVRPRRTPYPLSLALLDRATKASTVGDRQIERDFDYEPCPMCGQVRLVRIYTRYPTVQVGARPVEEHRAVNPNHIPDWREGEQSDNLSTRPTHSSTIYGPGYTGGKE